MTPPGPSERSTVVRGAWMLGGFSSVGLGTVGIIVPGLPTTVFFIVAAWCFSKSSPRLEQWVLDLPRIGPMVRDYRAGLGMPRRAKVAASATILVVVTISVVVFLDSWAVRAGVATAGLVGMAVITWYVPTREQVLAASGRPPPSTEPGSGSSLG